MHLPEESKQSFQSHPPPARSPLEIATDTGPPPLPVNMAEDCAACMRRIEAEADPLRDHVPQAAPKHKANRVLAILDQIDRENSNRRFTT